VIARPTERFTDYELLQIDQFLMRGNSLAVFLDPFKEVQAPGNPAMMMGAQVGFQPVDTGLKEMLAHYGVSLEPAYVMDENSYRQRLPEQFGGGWRPIYFAPLIQNEDITDRLPFMRQIKGLVALRIAPLELEQNRLADLELTGHRLFASSPRAWRMTSPINLNPATLRPPPASEEMRQFDLGFLVEGAFPSFFADKPLPQKPSDEGGDTEADAPEETPAEAPAEAGETTKGPVVAAQSGFVAQGRPGKIFVVGSAAMLTDAVIEAEGRSPNAIFIMNALDYLNDREAVAVMRSKEQRFNPLGETSPAFKTVAKTFNIAGVPVLVVILGLVVWALRAARQKRIQMQFAR
jgi:ABC-type uncharacterized transport system involved in gliding motility auxiliary subunit